jgi:glycosyltransferase involved in cell wall biosynthesis
MAARLPQNWSLHVLVHDEARDMLPRGFRGDLVCVRTSSELVHGAFALTSYVRKLQSDILLKTLESSGHVRIPTVTICHDIDALILAAQGRQPSAVRRYIDIFKHSLRRSALRNSEFVICNSEFTRIAVQSHYAIPPAHTAVAYCAVDTRFYEISPTVDKEKIRQRYGVRNFVLTFATGDPRENFKLLPEVAQKLKELGTQASLLIAGIRQASPYVSDLRARFVELGLVEGQHFILEAFLGADRFTDLVALYTAADFYLELSLHEGFGMQLAEAMACGTTCITSPNDALTEVSGGYGIFIDPASSESIATALKTSYDEKLHLRDNREQIAYTHKFSWDAMGEVVAGILLKLADKKSVI